MKFKLMKIVGSKTEEAGELYDVARLSILTSGETFHFWCVQFENGTYETFVVNEYLLVPMM